MVPFVCCQSYRHVWVNLEPSKVKTKEPTESLESTLRNPVADHLSPAKTLVEGDRGRDHALSPTSLNDVEVSSFFSGPIMSTYKDKCHVGGKQAT